MLLQKKSKFFVVCATDRKQKSNFQMIDFNAR